MSCKPWHNRQNVLSTWETHMTFNGLGGGQVESIFMTQDQFSHQTFRMPATIPFIITRYALFFQASGFVSGTPFSLELGRFSNCQFGIKTTIATEDLGTVTAFNIMQCICGEFDNPQAINPCDGWQARLFFDAAVDQPRGRLALLCEQL